MITKHIFSFVLLLAACTSVNADKSLWLEYGKVPPAPISVCLPDHAGPEDYQTTITFAAGDVQVIKDGAAGANIGTLPVATDNCWDFTPTATELQCAACRFELIDSATKVWMDTSVYVYTWGHPSAMAPNGMNPFVTSGNAQAGSTTSTTLASGTTFADDAIIGARIKIVAGTGVGQTAVISDWVDSTDIATHTTIITATDTTSEYIVEFKSDAIITVSGGVVEAKLISTDTDAITSASLAANTIGASEIAADAIGASELAADASTEIWAVSCEDQGGGYTCREVMSMLLAEALGTAVYTSGTRIWVVKDPSGTETRFTLVYGSELDGDRTTSTPAPFTP